MPYASYVDEMEDLFGSLGDDANSVNEDAYSSEDEALLHFDAVEELLDETL